MNGNCATRMEVETKTKIQQVSFQFSLEAKIVGLFLIWRSTLFLDQIVNV